MMMCEGKSGRKGVDTVNTEYTFFIGRRTTQGDWVPQEKFNDVERLLNSYYGGYTRFDAEGSYNSTKEEARVYLVLAVENDERAQIVATFARGVCQQECVLITKKEVKINVY